MNKSNDMRKMIILTMMFSIFISFVSIVSVPSPSYACSCIEPPSVEEEVERSEAVFSGEVLKVTNQKDYNGYKKKILFDVSTIWKGESQSQAIITTGQGGGDCGFDFQEGVEYLVYANPSSMYGDDDDLVTIICDRTTELKDAGDDLKVLGQGETPAEKIDLAEEQSKNRSSVLWFITGAVILIGTISIFLWRRMRNTK